MKRENRLPKIGSTTWIVSHNLKTVTKMNIKKIWMCAGVVSLSLLYTACTGPALVQKSENKVVPTSFGTSQDSTNTAKVKWKEFFTDPNLVALIDTALSNNQELNIILQEINI